MAQRIEYKPGYAGTIAVYRYGYKQEVYETGLRYDKKEAYSHAGRGKVLYLINVYLKDRS